jgi:energy-coupling factor transporter ATP-binding protein EcfA2
MVDPTTLATQVPWGSLIKATATAVELVRRQDWLAEAWRVLMLRLGSEHDIVILGAKGVGKTTLLDNLRGASAQASYALPPTSIRPEAAVTTLDGARAITVTPAITIAPVRTRSAPPSLPTLGCALSSSWSATASQPSAMKPCVKARSAAG